MGGCGDFFPQGSTGNKYKQRLGLLKLQSDPKSQELERGHGTDPEGSPESALPPEFLFPSPMRLQDTERVLLDKAELEAKVGRLTEEGEFPRTFYKEVRGFPRAPAAIPISQLDLEAGYPGGTGRDPGLTGDLL